MTTTNLTVTTIGCGVLAAGAWLAGAANPAAFARQETATSTPVLEMPFETREVMGCSPGFSQL